MRDKKDMIVRKKDTRVRNKGTGVGKTATIILPKRHKYYYIAENIRALLDTIYGGT